MDWDMAFIDKEKHVNIATTDFTGGSHWTFNNDNR